jgi:hypothetical protein
MSAGQLPILEEYDAMFEELGDHGAAFYKFFDMFRIHMENEGTVIKGVSFGKVGVWTAGTDEQLRELKTYWKEQRKWIKKEGKNAKAIECRRRMWFFVSRVMEWDMFHVNIRKEIYWWFDTCEERMEMRK